MIISNSSENFSSSKKMLFKCPKVLDLYKLTGDKSFLFYFGLSLVSSVSEWYLLCVKSQKIWGRTKPLSIILNLVSRQSREGEKANLVSRLTENSLYRDILREPSSITSRWKVSSEESFTKYVRICRLHPLSALRFIVWKAKEQNLDQAKGSFPFSNICIRTRLRA